MLQVYLIMELMMLFLVKELNSPFSKGGIVKNVPNVTDEPDEMRSRVTGQPFNETSEAAQDIEDRELKGQIKGLGL